MSGVTDDAERKPPAMAAKILINGQPEESTTFEVLPPPMADDDPSMTTAESYQAKPGDNGQREQTRTTNAGALPNTEAMEQSANFFDPKNIRAAQIREQVAMSTLDELLDYVLVEGGSVGILDATNSTLERRKLIMKRIRERAGPELGVLFLESLCVDENVSTVQNARRSTSCCASIDLFASYSSPTCD